MTENWESIWIQRFVYGNESQIIEIINKYSFGRTDSLAMKDGIFLIIILIIFDNYIDYF